MKASSAAKSAIVELDRVGELVSIARATVDRIGRLRLREPKDAERDQLLTAFANALQSADFAAAAEELKRVELHYRKLAKEAA